MSRHFIALLTLFAALEAEMGAQSAQAREILELRQGWKFSFAPKDSTSDSSWEKVELPHTWNISDGADGHGYRRGEGWYRLAFKAPQLKSKGRAYLEFDGANLVATAWLNGKELGTHYGGFSRFRFELGEALKPGEENLLRVKVDSSWRPDVPPLEGDFTMFGGLYRQVRLILTSELGIDLMDHGGPGVYLKSSGKNLNAKVRLSNPGSMVRKARVVVSLINAKGRAEAKKELAHAAGPGVTTAELDLKISSPHLWNGLKDPYLYTVLTEIFEGGELKDAHSEKFGFRTFHADPKKGFFLNGKPYTLFGVNLHQDQAAYGWAANNDAINKDFEIIKELGASFIRVVHYQSHPYIYDLCDSLGYVIWAEQAHVNKTGKGDLFAQRTLTQMTELIRQNFNRPSIAFWGISNEMQTPEGSGAKELLKRLATLTKQEDPARLCTLATNYEETGASYGEDVTAHNKYFGWYGGEFSEFPAWLDKQRAKAPKIPIGMAEYGAGAGPSIHYDKPAMMDHSEEFQSLYHESYWREIKARPWLFATSIWCLFDFASDGRAEGEGLGINDKGLVTRDRKINKDAFYFYKAQWSKDPFVYIASRRFVARTQKMTQVKVYSNQKQVELFLAGKSLGKKKIELGMAVWGNVELKPWGNRIEAKAGNATDACDWILNVYYNPWATPKKLE